MWRLPILTFRSSCVKAGTNPRPRHPEEDGMVENSGGYVKENAAYRARRAQAQCQTKPLDEGSGCSHLFCDSLLIS
jgi:hypothetical protein